MLGDRLLADLEMGCDLVDRERPLADQAQDLAPTRFGECLEGRFLDALQS